MHVPECLLREGRFMSVHLEIVRQIELISIHLEDFLTMNMML